MKSWPPRLSRSTAELTPICSTSGEEPTSVVNIGDASARFGGYCRRMGCGLEYTEHAETRMTQRRISREEVRLTVNNPDYIRPGDFGATNYYRELNGRTLRVALASHPFGSLTAS